MSSLIVFFYSSWNMPHSVVSIVLFAFLTLHGAICDLVDIFSTGSGFDLNSAVDIAFGLTSDPSGLVLEGPVTTPIEEDVTFWCASKTFDSLQQVYLDDPDVWDKIEANKSLTFITHGFMGNITDDWIQQSAQEMLQYTEDSVCLVSWGRLSRYIYPQVAQEHTLLVSQYLTKFVTFLNQQGMPLEKLKFVGNSLGAHICGQVGYNLKGAIGEIYGLDPAALLFTKPVDRGLSYRLDSSDAGYVQMIITTKDTLAVHVAEGHGNFYPHGGLSPQKSCDISAASMTDLAVEISCSHSYAGILFQRSINPSVSYVGHQCYNWIMYVYKLCNGNQADLLGINSNKIRGDFYLEA